MPSKYVLFSAALTLLTISLTGMFIDVGRRPDFLLDFPIITLDTTQLKDEILQSTNYIFPITDVLNLYFQTHCEGNYISTRNIGPDLKNVTCSTPSSDVGFHPADIIYLQLSNISSSQPIELPDNDFAHRLGEIQTKFAESYHAELHTAFAIYIIALCFESIVLVLALVSFLGIDVVWTLGVFSFLTTIFLLIGNIITTTCQYQVVATINEYGEDVGIAGYRGTGLLVLIWIALGVSCVATGAWGWGTWMSGGYYNRESAENKGMYMNCINEPVDPEVYRPVKLALRQGRVVRVDEDGISLKPEIDYDRESQIGPEYDRESQIGLAL